MSTETKQRIKGTAITAVQDTPENHTLILRQLKEVAEIGQRLRGDPLDSFVRVKELVQAGLVRLVNGTLQPSSTAVGGSSSSFISSLGIASANSAISVSGSPVNGGSGTITLTANQFGTSVAGIVPASGGGTTNFLRADGTWNAPSGSGGSGGNVTPDTHPSSATNWDDEFEVGSSIDTTGARFSGANPWTIVNNPGSSTNVVEAGGLGLKYKSTSLSVMLVTQPVPASGAWAFVGKLTGYTLSNGYAGAYRSGLVVYNSANGKFVNVGFSANGTSNGTGGYVECNEYNSVTSYNTSFGTIQVSTNVYGAQFPASTPWYFKISYDGTSTLTFAASTTGYPGSFVTLATQTVATFVGAMTGIGLYCGAAAFNSSSDFIYAYWDWFRRVL